ncbi:MAG: hypothetical protein HQL53_05285 [Magnetococcales bacterium]|nr:hypothetical protein [Magnetococcales bacterium]
MPRTPSTSEARLQAAAHLYRLDDWGGDDLRLLPGGDLAVAPSWDAGLCVSLPALMVELHAQGLSPPYLVRFPALLKRRIEQLYGAFSQVARRRGYGGGMEALYPIKVNPHRQVVGALAEAGGSFGMGLEVGSRAELQIALTHRPTPDALMACHGIKDDAYLHMALLAKRAGMRLCLVIETPSEARRILDLSQRLEIQPMLGVRLAPETMGIGAPGRRSFGLDDAQLQEVIRLLMAGRAMDGLEMVHLHLGSPFGPLEDLAQAVRLATRQLLTLRNMGAPLTLLDVGGGMGGEEGKLAWNLTAGRWHRYAETVMESIQGLCDEAGEAHPRIVTENGRALTASHAMLLLELCAPERMDAATVTACFSMIGSLPDAWAMGHRFPAMPLVGLDQPPALRAVLNDLTCDHDGRLTHFDLREEGQAMGLPLPASPSGGRLPLGIFMLGAYQEVLSGRHNLLGRPHMIDVRGDDRTGWRLHEVIPGDRAGALLREMGYDLSAGLEMGREGDGPGSGVAMLQDAMRAGLERYAYPEGLRTEDES